MIHPRLPARIIYRNVPTRQLLIVDEDLVGLPRNVMRRDEQVRIVN
jgi:hypothetical protein